MYGLIIFAVALAVRLIHVWQLRPSPFFDVLLGDAHGYDLWAQRIAGGEWIGSEVFYQAPLYPYFLGVLYAVFGRDLLVVRIVQAVIGSASCVLLAMAGARLFSRRVGVIAGLVYFIGAYAFVITLPIIAIALVLIPLAGFFQVFDGMQVVCGGILRGLGDTHSPLIANIAGFWVIGLPLGLWFGLRQGHGPAGLWWGLVIGLAVVGLGLLIRVRIRLSRAMRRVEVDGQVVEVSRSR